MYTIQEVHKARKLINEGYKHDLMVEGDPEFKRRVEAAVELIKTAGYYDFLRTYIRQIREISGLSQLREAEVAIWANKYALINPIEGAGFIIQKAQQMKGFLEDRLYYDRGELEAVAKRIEFLKTLHERSRNQSIKKKCEENLNRWQELTFP